MEGRPGWGRPFVARAPRSLDRERSHGGVDFNLAFIPPTFTAPHKEDFDTEYMRQLYDVGYDLAVKGFEWAKTPPGFTPPGDAPAAAAAAASK